MKPVHITPDSNDVQQNRIFALLSYFGILLLITGIRELFWKQKKEASS